MCIGLKFFNIFCGHLQNIWGFFLGSSSMRVEVFKAVLCPLKTFQGNFKRFSSY